MNQWNRIFLVALRIAIGWHFLYEGLFKIDSDTGATQYATGRYAIQSATQRLRDGIAQSPDAADIWHDAIVKAFASQKALGEDQKARLASLRDQVKLTRAVHFDWMYVHEEVLKVPPEQEGERFSSLGYLQGSAGPFRPLFRGLVADIDGLDRLTISSAHDRIDNRYREIVKHFQFDQQQQARLAAARDSIKESIATILSEPAFRSRAADYRALLQRVHGDSPGVAVPFSRERLDADQKKLDVMAGELLAFVNEPLSELAVQAQAIATVDQLRAGPLRRPAGPADWIDRAIKWELTIVGALLLLGLFTPAAALAAAGQLAIFYLASPPWPGLPGAGMGGHYLYVDRNLIEMIAALVIATTATGRWAGLDAYWRRKTAATVLATSPEAVAAEAR